MSANMSTDLPVERVVALDHRFGPMAVDAGGYAMGVPGLSVREKSFVWLTHDVCCGRLGLPYELHLAVAAQAGATSDEIREVLRHLAPYAGYPAVVEAFERLQQISGSEPESPSTVSAVTSAEPAPSVDNVDTEFEEWVKRQVTDRWTNPLLSPRERALLCVTVDVLYQTLDAPMRAHVRAASSAGVDGETLRNLLRLLSELAMGKVWQAFPALEQHLRAIETSQVRE